MANFIKWGITLVNLDDIRYMWCDDKQCDITFQDKSVWYVVKDKNPNTYRDTRKFYDDKSMAWLVKDKQNA